jgi:hypothetical protein
MRPVSILGFFALASLLTAVAPAFASKPDPDDFPLRVHIMKFITQAAPRRQKTDISGVPQFSEGRGVADLFENSTPAGFQFDFSCTDAIAASSGYGTYPARWKKQDRTLEILIPETGKPWNLDTCDLRTTMRPGLAFIWKNGNISEEAATALKDWMVKHKYDPEKGYVDPIQLPSEVSPSGDPLVESPLAAP